MNKLLKICTKCGNNKELYEFYNNRTSKDGKQGWCKACMDSYNRHNINTEYVQEYCQDYYRDNKEELMAYTRFWLEQGNNRKRHNKNNRACYHRNRQLYNASRKIKRLIKKYL